MKFDDHTVFYIFVGRYELYKKSEYAEPIADRCVHIAPKI